MATNGYKQMKKNKAIINTRKKEKIISEQKYIHDYTIGLAVNNVHINRCWYKFNCGITILGGWEEKTERWYCRRQPNS